LKSSTNRNILKLLFLSVSNYWQTNYRLKKYQSIIDCNYINVRYKFSLQNSKHHYVPWKKYRKNCTYQFSFTEMRNLKIANYFRDGLIIISLRNTTMGMSDACFSSIATSKGSRNLWVSGLFSAGTNAVVTAATMATTGHLEPSMYRTIKPITFNCKLSVMNDKFSRNSCVSRSSSLSEYFPARSQGRGSNGVT